MRLLIWAEAEAKGPRDLKQIGRSFRSELTGAYVSGEMKHLLWTHVARVLLGRPAPREECEELWRSVSFSNAEPSEFEAVARSLKAERILILGETLWRARPALDCKAELIAHPASHGFAFRDWITAAQSLLRP